MDGRPESNEALICAIESVAENDVESVVKRLLPGSNPDPADRALAWCEWYARVGEGAVLAFIKTMNDSPEPDADILQDAMMTAYMSVERGAYKPCEGVPFTAYVKGIARNKIREARRRKKLVVSLEETVLGRHESVEQQPHLAYHAMPELVVERQERQSTLWTGISRLSESRQEVLQGYLRGDSTPEIAETLGISEELVRQHKSRGLRSLRQMDLFAV